MVVSQAGDHKVVCEVPRRSEKHDRLEEDAAERIRRMSERAGGEKIVDGSRVGQVDVSLEKREMVRNGD